MKRADTGGARVPSRGRHHLPSIGRRHTIPGYEKNTRTPTRTVRGQPMTAAACGRRRTHCRTPFWPPRRRAPTAPALPAKRSTTPYWPAGACSGRRRTAISDARTCRSASRSRGSAHEHVRRRDHGGHLGALLPDRRRGDGRGGLARRQRDLRGQAERRGGADIGLELGAEARISSELARWRVISAGVLLMVMLAIAPSRVLKKPVPRANGPDRPSTAGLEAGEPLGLERGVGGGHDVAGAEAAVQLVQRRVR